MKDHDVERAARDLVREEVDLPSDGLDRALATAQQTPQQRPRRWWPFGRNGGGDAAATDADEGQRAATTRPGRRLRVAGILAAGALVMVVIFFAGVQLGDDEAVVAPAASVAPVASVAPTFVVAPPSCMPSGGGPGGPCPVMGSADITNTTQSRSTILPIRTVGSSFAGPGEPFELYYENENNELSVIGIAEPGTYRGDAPFIVAAETSDVGVSTDDGSDCILQVSFVDAWSLSGGFSCEDHPSIVGDAVSEDTLIDVSGAFEVSIAERGAASAYRSDSYSQGWESQMFSYDSALLFDGRLESMEAEFPDGPMRLSYRADDGSTMEVTGTTSEGTFTEDDGFSLVIDDSGSGFFDLDPDNSDCIIQVERAVESAIAADFECRFVGRSVGGTFDAVP